MNEEIKHIPPVAMLPEAVEDEHAAWKRIQLVKVAIGLFSGYLLLIVGITYLNLDYSIKLVSLLGGIFLLLDVFHSFKRFLQ